MIPMRFCFKYMCYNRPTLDDIERISKGQAANRRGTGSRMVPHRLNNAERKEWELAKKRKFLQLRGTGWRKERGDSPLANIYRNHCDAKGIPYISIIRAIGINEIEDKVVIDFSPVRVLDLKNAAAQCIAIAKEFPSLTTIDDGSDIATQGWQPEDIDRMLKEDVIWRIPAFGITVGFTVRAESKRFAEDVAVQLVGADPISHSNSIEEEV